MATLLLTGAPARARTVAEPGSVCPPDGVAAAIDRRVSPVLTVTYWGVSTLMFSDGRDRLLIDGFFSRPSVRTLLTSSLRSQPDRVAEGLGIGQPAVRAVLTAHAHHDHALDITTIAVREPAAVIVGTPSVARLATGQGVSPTRVCVPADGRAMVFGPFRVTAFHVPHGPSPFFLRWLLDHPLERDLPDGGWFWSFDDDRNLSYLIEHGGRRILVHPSSGTRDLSGLGADTVFLGVGRLGVMEEGEAQRYWDAIVGRETTTVVPIHWDQFTTRVGQPLRPTTRLLDNVGAGLGRVRTYASLSPALRVVMMDAGDALDISPVGQGRLAARVN
jgi:L-ascorbate metabolism protein UlaG (beta-lactamase superfamily)